MGYLDKFGFEFFRLREARDNDEFLLFNKKKNSYNQYSKKRLLQILTKEFEQIKFDFKAFAEYLEKEFEIKAITVRDIVDQDHKLIDNLGYMPSDDITFIDDDKEFFNVYRKSKLLKKQDLAKGSFKFIEQLILNLVGGKETEYNYIINWLAWIIQNPLKRLPTSLILQGEHGTGKTKFCELILKPIFERNFCEIGQSDINKEYNDYILGKQIIIANEVIHNDNKLLVPDKLKNYVTDEYLSINRKFKDTIYVRNFAQWIFVTNNSIPLKIEKGDRRYSVFKSKKLENGRELIGNLLANHDHEIESFLYHLLTIKPDYNVVAAPLENEAKKDIIKMSQNSIEEFIDFALEQGGFDKLNNFYESQTGVDIWRNLLEVQTKDYGTVIRTDKFYKLYLRFCLDFGINMKFSRSGFTKQLKFLGFGSKVAKIDEEIHRVTIIGRGAINE